MEAAANGVLRRTARASRFVELHLFHQSLRQVIGSLGTYAEVRRRMNPEYLSKLIACLESARLRPAMYFGATDVPSAVQFLNGFQLAVGAGFEQEPTLREQVVKARGWSWSAMHPYRYMSERGMSDAAIIDELLTIEIEVLRSLAEHQG